MVSTIKHKSSLLILALVAGSALVLLLVLSLPEVLGPSSQPTSSPLVPGSPLPAQSPIPAVDSVRSKSMHWSGVGARGVRGTSAIGLLNNSVKPSDPVPASAARPARCNYRRARTCRTHRAVSRGRAHRRRARAADSRVRRLRKVPARGFAGFSRGDYTARWYGSDAGYARLYVDALRAPLRRQTQTGRRDLPVQSPVSSGGGLPITVIVA